MTFPTSRNYVDPTHPLRNFAPASCSTKYMFPGVPGQKSYKTRYTTNVNYLEPYNPRGQSVSAGRNGFRNGQPIRMIGQARRKLHGFTPRLGTNGGCLNVAVRMQSRPDQAKRSTIIYEMISLKFTTSPFGDLVLFEGNSLYSLRHSMLFNCNGS